MDIEKKRSCALSTLIILAVVVPIGYFLWMTIFNKGTLIVLGSPPFSVNIYREGRLEINTECSKSPCLIKQKSGEKKIMITKAEYEIFEKTTEIKRGKNTEIKAELTRIPDMQKITEFPKGGDEQAYKLVYDEKTKMQKLVDEKDLYERAIVYFPNEIKNPKVVGAGNTVLVVNREDFNTGAYKININTKERILLNGENFKDIIEGKWSKDGKYLVYSVEASNYLWIVSENESAKRLKISAEIPRTAWNINNDLIFATNQEEELTNLRDKYGRREISLKENKIESKYLFGIYDPLKDSYSKMERFELSEPPINLFTLGNGKELYFESSKEKYKIELY